MKIMILLIFCLAMGFAGDPADGCVGTWLTQGGKAHIEIHRHGDRYDGKLVWTKTPNKPDGTPKVDDKNPDPALRTRPLVGLPLLSGFEYEGDNVWEEGKIYDPESGKLYSCILTLKDENTLFVRGYIGISLIGRTQTWTRVSETE